jgi:hypothetical protein
MPHDPITVRTELVRDAAGHEVLMVEKYEAPAGDYDLETRRYRLAPDEYKDYDMWVARRTMALLKTVYPGHFWFVEADMRNKIVKISIPILMGVTNFYVINLVQTELTPGAVIVAGGEILERYVISRSRFHVDSFLDARQKHSALVFAGRKVPT